jgi:hypothetical protein
VGTRRLALSNKLRQNWMMKSVLRWCFRLRREYRLLYSQAWKQHIGISNRIDSTGIEPHEYIRRNRLTERWDNTISTLLLEYKFLVPRYRINNTIIVRTEVLTTQMEWMNTRNYYYLIKIKLGKIGRV